MIKGKVTAENYFFQSVRLGENWHVFFSDFHQTPKIALQEYEDKLLCCLTYDKVSSLYAFFCLHFLFREINILLLVPHKSANRLSIIHLCFYYCMLKAVSRYLFFFFLLIYFSFLVFHPTGLNRQVTYIFSVLWGPTASLYYQTDSFSPNMST